MWSASHPNIRQASAAFSPGPPAAPEPVLSAYFLTRDQYITVSLRLLTFSRNVTKFLVR